MNVSRFNFRRASQTSPAASQTFFPPDCLSTASPRRRKTIWRGTISSAGNKPQETMPLPPGPPKMHTHTPRSGLPSRKPSPGARSPSGEVGVPLPSPTLPGRTTHFPPLPHLSHSLPGRTTHFPPLPHLSHSQCADSTWCALSPSSALLIVWCACGGSVRMRSAATTHTSARVRRSSSCNISSAWAKPRPTRTQTATRSWCEKRNPHDTSTSAKQTLTLEVKAARLMF